MLRKTITVLAVAGLLAAPALADTLTNVTTKGVVMSVQGMQIPITYTPDGAFSLEAMGTAISGKWRIDGTKLCTTSDMSPDERCTEYPAGKEPGDTFEITGAMGTATITINK
jgi:hypothetical protein